MYDDIVDGLIREYPHLLHAGGLPPASARVSVYLLYVVFKIVHLSLFHPELSS
jgi:hypothetical protein